MPNKSHSTLSRYHNHAASTDCESSHEADARERSAYRRLRHVLDLSRYVHLLESATAEAGLHLTLGINFVEYVQITKAIAGKTPTYPNFRPDTSGIRAGDGFWLLAVDRNDKIAHVQANRLYDLRCTNLSDHLQSLRANYADPTNMAPPGSSCVCLAPSAQTITGRVSYHGDFWLREDYRGRGMYRTMSRLAQAISVAAWWPNYLFGLVSLRSTIRGTPSDERVQRVAMKRISMIYGTCSSEPHGSILDLPSENIKDDDWLIWSTPEDVLDAAGVSIRNRRPFASAS